MLMDGITRDTLVFSGTKQVSMLLRLRDSEKSRNVNVYVILIVFPDKVIVELLC